MKQLNSCFDCIGFKATPKLGHLDEQHRLIMFSNQEDYQRCFLRRSWTLNGSHMRVTKWTPDSDPKFDNFIVPIWVSIRGSPLFLHNKTAFRDVAHMIGTPLRMDSVTIQGLRPSVVRLCVEIDISKALPCKLHIQGGPYEFYPTVEYKDVPFFCPDCRILGHDHKTCGQPPLDPPQIPVASHPAGHSHQVGAQRRWTSKKAVVL